MYRYNGCSFKNTNFKGFEICKTAHQNTIEFFLINSIYVLLLFNKHCNKMEQLDVPSSRKNNLNVFEGIAKSKVWIDAHRSSKGWSCSSSHKILQCFPTKTQQMNKSF